MCADRFQRARDWLAHRVRMQGVFDTIAAGYYVMVNDGGVKSFKVIDHRCFRYIAFKRDDDRVGMRVAADSTSRSVFGLNWQLCKCNDDGYYLRYRAIYRGPIMESGHNRINDVSAFARRIVALSNSLPEPY